MNYQVYVLLTVGRSPTVSRKLSRNNAEIICFDGKLVAIVSADGGNGVHWLDVIAESDAYALQRHLNGQLAIQVRDYLARFTVVNRLIFDNRHFDRCAEDGSFIFEVNSR
ncbi:MAG: hypothetical protein ACI3VQ_03925 [Faecousia sp.]